jgi:hypothetical protein
VVMRMVDFVIELILLATILVPMIATSLRPARVANRTGLFRKLPDEN